MTGERDRVAACHEICDPGSYEMILSLSNADNPFSQSDRSHDMLSLHAGVFHCDPSISISESHF